MGDMFGSAQEQERKKEIATPCFFLGGRFACLVGLMFGRAATTELYCTTCQKKDKVGMEPMLEGKEGVMKGSRGAVSALRACHNCILKLRI